MGKDFIKKLLRENLFNRLKEVGKKTDDKDNGNEPNAQQQTKSDEEQKVTTMTKKIKNATQGPDKLMKLSQVMDKAGVGDADDASDRSLYGKKVSGKPDANGEIRHLTPDEADKMSKIVDNPGAFN